MKNIAFTWWQDRDFYLGYLNEYPDYETQGFSLEELQQNLKEIYLDLESGLVPFVRHLSQLTIA